MSFGFLFYLTTGRIINYNIIMINSLKILRVSPGALPTHPWNILVIKDFECQAHGLNHINYPWLLLVVNSSCSLHSFTHPIDLCFKDLLWVRCCAESWQLLGKGFTLWWENSNDYYAGQGVYSVPSFMWRFLNHAGAGGCDPNRSSLLLWALRAPSCLAHLLLAWKVLPRRTSILGACLWGLTPGLRNPSGTTATLGTAPSPDSGYFCPLGFQTVRAECRERWEGERLEREKGEGRKGEGTWRELQEIMDKNPGWPCRIS